MVHVPENLVVIRRQISDILPFAFGALAREADEEGYDFVARFVERWNSGESRFDAPGEGMFAAWAETEAGLELAGMAGIVRDPYVDDPHIARLRHVYVAPRYRGRGIAEDLVKLCLNRARDHFRLARLRALNAAAARIYERQGFVATTTVAECTHILELQPARRHDG